MARTQGAATTLYLYDAWNCIAEYSIQNSAFTIQHSRLWGLDLSGTLQGAGGVGGMLCESQISNPQITNYYPTYDGNGNISEYLAQTGTPAARFEYDPFGNTVVNTDATNQFAYRFSTKPADAATGLYYYGYRYYDPVTGRWPSRDPIGERGGVNLYGFVGNDGVGRWDILGMADIIVTIVREYREWETVGDFTAVAPNKDIAKCCGSVLGQTLELKRGRYHVHGGPDKPYMKNYPIWEGPRSGVYSFSGNTSINGQIDDQNWKARASGSPLKAYPVLPGDLATHNINVISNKGMPGNSDFFLGTRMHHGNSCQSSTGCPIVGSGMEEGRIPNWRYPDFEVPEFDENGKWLNPDRSGFDGHYFPPRKSVEKVIELNAFVECVKKQLGSGKNPKTDVIIRSK